MIEEAVPAACLYFAGATFREFVDESPRSRALIQTRYGETRIDTSAQAFLNDYPDVHNWAVVVAEDSPDTVIVLPILQRIAEANPRSELRVFNVDDDLILLEPFLPDALNGEDGSDLDTPLLLLLDEEFQLLEQWGPRPHAAESHLDGWLDGHEEYEALAEDDSDEGQLAYGELLDLLTLEMRVWYNSGLTRNCVVEIMDLMKEVQSNEEEEGNAE